MNKQLCIIFTFLGVIIGAIFFKENTNNTDWQYKVLAVENITFYGEWLVQHTECKLSLVNLKSFRLVDASFVGVNCLIVREGDIIEAEDLDKFTIIKHE